MPTIIHHIIYVDVIVALNIRKALTYSVPIELHNEIEIGKRVQISIKSKNYAAVISKIHTITPAFVVKPIIDILDARPILHQPQLDLWFWMSDYYMATIGSVMQAALPGALKLSSESYFYLSDSWDNQWDTLTVEEQKIIEALHNQPHLTVADVQQVLMKKSVLPIINKLSEKRVLIIAEFLQEKYKPKTEEIVTVSNTIDWQQIINDLERSHKQQNIVLAWLEMSKLSKMITKKELLKRADATTAQMQALVQKKIFIVTTIEVNRIVPKSLQMQSTPTLSIAQKECYDAINKIWEHKNTVLLHGITGSGKTNIYMQLAKEVLSSGKQVLFLLPEIALTHQITERLKHFFGPQLKVYHSKFNHHERVEIWNSCLDSSPIIVLGARSALFLPLQNIGLILVDEEHDSSYKQGDDPHYQARDSALVLAAMQKVKVILGSATPSVESLYLARTNKYGYVQLNTRYNDAEPSKITIINTKDASKRKLMHMHFSQEMLERIEQNMADGNQTMVFQNRRGYAPCLQCHYCDWTAKCKHCDVSLTYHKQKHEMRCHYCGYVQAVITQCGNCGGNDIRQKGLGTERLEDDLKTILPLARLARMDLDTARNKDAHQEILGKMELGVIDILIGTQMISKGLDFGNVTLVCIVNADQLFMYPDFRTNEKALQLITQVAGRAGRAEKKGEVLIQTSQPEHPILQNVINNEFTSFYERELLQRDQFKYPPFYRLIELKLLHKKEETVQQAAYEIQEYLKKSLGARSMGVSIPPVSRIRNQYIRIVLVKIKRESDDIKAIKVFIQTAIDHLVFKPEYKQVLVRTNVDPG